MTEEEYRIAALCGLPVVCNGVRYNRITAVRFPEQGRGKVMLELQCVTGRSVTVAQPEAVEPSDRRLFDVIKTTVQK